jgi:integrase/recombinase XerD
MNVPFVSVHKSWPERSDLTLLALRVRTSEAMSAWLLKSPSKETRRNYAQDLRQFFAFAGILHEELERLLTVTPAVIAAWRDDLLARGLCNSSVSRKMTVLRSLFTYLGAYGYTGPNPARSDFVSSPKVPRDGKTVAIAPCDCRRLLDAPPSDTPEGIRDRALLALLAYTGCRVGELCRLRLEDFKISGIHRVLEIRGKGGKERRIAVHPEAVERLELWCELLGPNNDLGAALFRPTRTARGKGWDGFKPQPLSTRGVEYLVERYVRWQGLDPNITVHSFRVTALTTARERGCDIVDIMDYAGHADPQTTLAYIRNRDRLSKSPAYVLRY